MRSLGVLCARGASKRLPRKHLLPLAGVPLVAWMCRAAAASRLDRVVMSTEDAAIAEIARANGVEAPFIRPAHLAEDFATDCDIVFDALQRCEAEETHPYDVVVMLQPTTPFTRPEDIDACLDTLAGDPGLGCCFTARPVSEPAQWMFLNRSDGRAEPLFSGVGLNEIAHKQKLPPAWFPAGAAYAVRTEALRAQRKIYALPLAFHAMPTERAIDIDHEIDLLFAETVARKRGFEPAPLSGRSLGSAAPAIKGRSLVLCRLMPDQVDSRYLGWLNDPATNAYSQRFGKTISMTEAKAYLARLQLDEHVFGIHHETYGHVGNIKYGPIDHTNRRADISILIGEPSARGKGIGREAVYLLTNHLFLVEGLNRVDAGSSNPAFLRMVQSLGWQIEGCQRERVLIGDRFVDWTLVGLLRSAFVEQPEYRAADHAAQ
jgi:N-acylneuraminate cytidylyltransferase